MGYDYFYSMETRPYKYFIIPQMLILDEQFSALSDRARILYCVMLDRSSMSAKNGWIDDQGRVYIIMARDEVMKKMNCSHTTAHKYIQELIDFGLIKKRRRGQGKPDLIYVMNFNRYAEAGEEPVIQEGREALLPEGRKPFPQEGREALLPEGRKPFPPEGRTSCPELDLYNNTNINSSSSSDEDIRRNLGYKQACQNYPEIIVDLLYRELVKRDQKVLGKITQTAFLTLCDNVTNYHGKVANVEAYIAKCIDNMLLAVSVNMASHSPPVGTSRNLFNKFQQNTYDFELLEKKLLADSR